MVLGDISAAKGFGGQNDIGGVAAFQVLKEIGKSVRQPRPFLVPKPIHIAFGQGRGERGVLTVLHETVRRGPWITVSQPLKRLCVQKQVVLQPG